jgi:hypothetical protein
MDCLCRALPKDMVIRVPSGVAIVEQVLPGQPATARSGSFATVWKGDVGTTTLGLFCFGCWPPNTAFSFGKYHADSIGIAQNLAAIWRRLPHIADCLPPASELQTFAGCELRQSGLPPKNLADARLCALAARQFGPNEWRLTHAPSARTTPGTPAAPAQPWGGLSPSTHHASLSSYGSRAVY